MARLSTVFALLSLVPAYAASPDFTLQKIGNGVWAAIVSDEGKAGGNAGFIVGDDGVAVIDTFENPLAAADFLAEIRKITKLPIRFVVNTHYHLDHVNGNDVFAAAGATIIAHRNVRAWMRTENIKMLGSSPSAEMKARVESLTLPNVVHDSRVDLYLGSRRIEVQYFAGHTGGDSVVWLPDAHVVFCGDMLWKEHLPNLIDATTAKWITSLDAMRSNYGASTWVPGHGGVATGEDMQTFRKYMADLRDAVGRARSQGKHDQSLVEALLPDLRAKYGKWGFFDDFASPNILQTEQELAGSKRVPR